jgi:6-phosphogluconate dehydrogenase
MDREMLKDVIYGGIVELMSNRKYYYSSGVSHTYNEWTEDGRRALKSYMILMTAQIAQAEEEEMDRRSKDYIMNTLKGDSKQSV